MRPESLRARETNISAMMHADEFRDADRSVSTNRCQRSESNPIQCANFNPPHPEPPTSAMKREEGKPRKTRRTRDQHQTREPTVRGGFDNKNSAEIAVNFGLTARRAERRFSRCMPNRSSLCIPCTATIHIQMNLRILQSHSISCTLEKIK